MGIVILVLIAVGVFLSPELRSNPVAVGLAVLVLLGALGLLLRWKQQYDTERAMIEMNERQKRG